MSQTSAPTLLVVGHVTRDHIAGTERLGGAAAFASLAAAHLGVETALVTAAPRDFDLLTPLRGVEHLSLHVVESPLPTAFELVYTPAGRRIRYLSGASPLWFEHIPAAWRAPAMAYIGPVIGECRAELIENLSCEHILVGAQGWLRTTQSDGSVTAALAPEAERLPHGISAVIFSELDHPDAEALAWRYADACPIVALTRGARGSTLWHHGERCEIEPFAANEVDPTGAGDVFALTLGLARRHGMTVRDAARAASFAAARVVEGPGLGALAQVRSFDQLFTQAGLA